MGSLEGMLQVATPRRTLLADPGTPVIVSALSLQEIGFTRGSASYSPPCGRRRGLCPRRFSAIVRPGVSSLFGSCQLVAMMRSCEPGNGRPGRTDASWMLAYLLVAACESAVCCVVIFLRNRGEESSRCSCHAVVAG
jgi:hypothetical protein